MPLINMFLLSSPPIFKFETMALWTALCELFLFLHFHHLENILIEEPTKICSLIILCSYIYTSNLLFLESRKVYKQTHSKGFRKEHQSMHIISLITISSHLICLVCSWSLEKHAFFQDMIIDFKFGFCGFGWYMFFVEMSFKRKSNPLPWISEHMFMAFQKMWEYCLSCLVQIK